MWQTNVRFEAANSFCKEIIDILQYCDRQAPLFPASFSIIRLFYHMWSQNNGLISTLHTHKHCICPSVNKGISEVDGEVLKAICS